MSNTIYIPSTSTDEKLTADGEPTWAISVIKSRTGILAVASEGAQTKTPTYTSFKVSIFDCRRAEIRLEGSRMTQKVIATGLAAMQAKLVRDGLATLPAASKIAA